MTQTESQTTTAAEIDAVLKLHPSLTHGGMVPRYDEDVAHERQLLRNATDEVERARNMLRDPRNLSFYAGRRVSSYHLKHVSEAKSGRYLGYVSQGALIVGALLEGFQIEHECPQALRAIVHFPGKTDHNWSWVELC